MALNSVFPDHIRIIHVLLALLGGVVSLLVAGIGAPVFAAKEWKAFKGYWANFKIAPWATVTGVVFFLLSKVCTVAGILLMTLQMGIGLPKLNPDRGGMLEAFASVMMPVATIGLIAAVVVGCFAWLGNKGLKSLTTSIPKES